jgi:hypothetical protein
MKRRRRKKKKERKRKMRRRRRKEGRGVEGRGGGKVISIGSWEDFIFCSDCSDGKIFGDILNRREW